MPWTGGSKAGECSTTATTDVHLYTQFHQKIRQHSNWQFDINLNLYHTAWDLNKCNDSRKSLYKKGVWSFGCENIFNAETDSGTFLTSFLDSLLLLIIVRFIFLFLHLLAKHLRDCWGVLYNWQFPIFIFFSLQVHWSLCPAIATAVIAVIFLPDSGISLPLKCLREDNRQPSYHCTTSPVAPPNTSARTP